MSDRLTPISTRKDGYERTLALLPKVLKEIEDILDTGEPREKLDASRVVGQLINFLAPPEPPETGGAISPAMLIEAVAGLFRDRHPQVLEAARLAGVAIVPVLDTTGEEANASQEKR